jgi:hypothetical protein
MPLLRPMASKDEEGTVKVKRMLSYLHNEVAYFDKIYPSVAFHSMMLIVYILHSRLHPCIDKVLEHNMQTEPRMVHCRL